MNKSRFFTSFRMTFPSNFAIATQSLTGKDKGRGDGFDRFPSTPILAFPHQGERRSSKMQPYVAFSFSVGERKIMSHFMERSYEDGKPSSHLCRYPRRFV